MNELFKILVSKFDFFYKDNQKNLPVERVSYHLMRGATGVKYRTKRQQNYLVTFNSFSLDEELAYKRLVEVREHIYFNKEKLKNLGIDIEIDAIPTTQDLSYIEANEHIFRFMFELEFLALEVVG